jgi:hypothetical protein
MENQNTSCRQMLTGEKRLFLVFIIDHHVYGAADPLDKVYMINYLIVYEKRLDFREVDKIHGPHYIIENRRLKKGLLSWRISNFIIFIPYF